MTCESRETKTDGIWSQNLPDQFSFIYMWFPLFLFFAQISLLSFGFTPLNWGETSLLLWWFQRGQMWSTNEHLQKKNRWNCAGSAPKKKIWPAQFERFPLRLRFGINSRCHLCRLKLVSAWRHVNQISCGPTPRAVHTERDYSNYCFKSHSQWGSHRKQYRWGHFQSDLMNDRNADSQ